MEESDSWADRKLPSSVDEKPEKEPSNEENEKESSKMGESDSWADRKLPSSLDEKLEKEPSNEENMSIADEEKTMTEGGFGLWRNINGYVEEYCANSSLHGVKYFVEQGKTVTERVWWFLIFIVSILMCTWQIHKTWDKWDSSPIIVSSMYSPTSIWHVPFPAVTICSETKSRQSVYNFTKTYYRYHNASFRGNFEKFFTPEELESYEAACVICNSCYLEKANDTIDRSTLLDFIHKVAPPLDEMMIICKWKNKRFFCRKLFHPMLTEEGLCYTFNMLDSQELLNSEAQEEHYWNHSEQADWSRWLFRYKFGSAKEVYPRRTAIAGPEDGLSILLGDYDYDLDYLCKGLTQGFKILLHNPAETPRFGHEYFRAPLNQEVIVKVEPHVMTTSDGLKDYHPSRRHCYFEKEKLLRYYKVYSLKNCEVECLANFTLQSCGCVAYYMPRANNTPICGPGKKECMSYSQSELVSREVESELLAQKRDDVETELKNDMNKCNCLPACSSLQYSTEISQSHFNWRKMFESRKMDAGKMSGIQLTQVEIFFKDTEFVASRRSEIYGPTDFLANCGGLVGLFMGFSFISFVEIVYFVTLRMWCNIKMHGRIMWNKSKVKSKILKSAETPRPMNKGY